MAGCTGPADEASTREAKGSGQPTGLDPAADPGFGHVHGVGFNPGDGAVYAATHFGVWRIPVTEGRPDAGGTRPVRIADRWQDTMGFTVAGPDLFYGSGHPDLREDAPPHLGFIRSRDRAESWQPVALAGEADFHDLAAVGSRVYGYDATAGLLRVSDDSGRSWQNRAPLPIRDLIVDPANPDRLVATTENGLLVSQDAGTTFQPLPGAPKLVVVGWASRILAGADAEGIVWSATGGSPDAEWKRRGQLTGAPQAFTVTSDGRLLAADELGVQISTGGTTWTLLASYDGTSHD